MATKQSTDELTMHLSSEERDLLLQLLEQAVKLGRVEEHRTDSLQAREIVQDHLDGLERLVGKVRSLA